ncbi:MAG: phosphatase PAP2 family protein [Paludibacteraceae bacterium]
MDSLIHIDQQWLLAINGWHAEWADMLMWYVSKSTTWLPLYALLVGLVVYRFGIGTPSNSPHKGEGKKLPSTTETNLAPSLCREGWGGSLLRLLIIFAGFAVAVGMSDFVSSGVIKPWVCRLRPTHEPALAGMVHLVNGYTGGMYGFVSSHAANTMACALLFSLLYRNRYATVGLMLWVALNCYSRMYLGVHYPGDIIGGLLVGALLATLTYAVVRRLLARVDERLAYSEASCKQTADDEGSPTAGS